MKWSNAGAPNCCICDEISSGQFPQAYRSVYNEESRICYETSEFVVLPTVSPLREGHVLVLPREHVTCLSALSPLKRGSLLECVDTVRHKMAARYGSELYFFEHGTRSAGLACGIDHAHLHIVPLPVALVEMVEARIESDLPTGAHSSFENVLTIADRIDGQCYLLHGRSLGAMRISFRDGIPSQYVRRLIASLEFRADWDWKLLGGHSEFRSTYKTVKAACAR